MENLRGAALMTAAMAGFAVEDMFIKWISVHLPTGQILMLLGLGGAVIFGAWALMRGDRLLSRDLLAWPVALRNTGEMIGTLGFISAIILTPISSASAILQANPLAVTLGAALFLGERVGWRRWTAILVGFAGVLMIVRPGLDGFEATSLLAVVGVIGLAIRDIATRLVPRSITSRQLSTYAFALLVPTGALLSAALGTPAQPVTGQTWALLAGMLVMAVLAYAALVAAMRMGDVSVITPFRYSRLIFAMLIGVVVFGERPDGMTLAGSALIMAAGLYTLMREARLARAARR